MRKFSFVLVAVLVATNAWADPDIGKMSQAEFAKDVIDRCQYQRQQVDDLNMPLEMKDSIKRGQDVINSTGYSKLMTLVQWHAIRGYKAEVIRFAQQLGATIAEVKFPSEFPNLTPGKLKDTAIASLVAVCPNECADDIRANIEAGFSQRRQD